METVKSLGPVSDFEKHVRGLVECMGHGLTLVKKACPHCGRDFDDSYQVLYPGGSIFHRDHFGVDGNSLDQINTYFNGLLSHFNLEDDLRAMASHMDLVLEESHSWPLFGPDDRTFRLARPGGAVVLCRPDDPAGFGSSLEDVQGFLSGLTDGA